jgi:hypothetical protein
VAITDFSQTDLDQIDLRGAAEFSFIGPKACSRIGTLVAVRRQSAALKLR